MDDGPRRGGVASQLPREGCAKQLLQSHGERERPGERAHMCCDVRGSLQQLSEFV